MKQYKKSKTARLKFASEISKKNNISLLLILNSKKIITEGIKEGLSLNLEINYSFVKQLISTE